MTAAVSAPEVTAEPALDPRSAAIAIVQAKADEASEPADESAESSPPAEGSPAGSEPPAEPPPDPKAERVAARILAAKKAEIRAHQQREALTQRQSAIEAREKELAAKEARFRRLEEDPVAAFDELKLDPKTFLEKLAGLHTPEAQTSREIAKERERIEALEKRLAQADEDRKRYELQLRGREVETNTRQATEAFLEHVATSAAKYPHLTDQYTPEEISARALQVATEHAEAYKSRFGVYPDDEVIADFLEQEAAERAQRRAAWRERIGQGAPAQGRASKGEIASGQGKAGTPRTLTNSTASQRGAAPKAWSEKDAYEEAKRIVKQLHEASPED